MDLEVIEYLSRLQGSTFVRAFLLTRVIESAERDHPLRTAALFVRDLGTAQAACWPVVAPRASLVLEALRQEAIRTENRTAARARLNDPGLFRSFWPDARPTDRLLSLRGDLMRLAREMRAYGAFPALVESAQQAERLGAYAAAMSAASAASTEADAFLAAGPGARAPLVVLNGASLVRAAEAMDTLLPALIARAGDPRSHLVGPLQGALPLSTLARALVASAGPPVPLQGGAGSPCGAFPAVTSERPTLITRLQQQHEGASSLGTALTLQSDRLGQPAGARDLAQSLWTRASAILIAVEGLTAEGLQDTQQAHDRTVQLVALAHEALARVDSTATAYETRRVAACRVAAMLAERAAALDSTWIALSPTITQQFPRLLAGTPEALDQAAREMLEAVAVQHVAALRPSTMASFTERAALERMGELSSAGFSTRAERAVELTSLTASAAPPAPAPSQPLWALTNVLFQRAQEEVVTSFLYRLSAWINEEPRRQALSVIFKSTNALVGQPGGRLFETPRAAWRTALREDAQRLPETLLTNEQVLAGLGVPNLNHPTTRMLRDQIAAAARVGQSVMAGVAPLDLAIDLPQLIGPIRFESGDAGTQVLAASHVVAAVARDLRMQGFRPAANVNPAALPRFVLSTSQFDAAGTTHRRLYVRLLIADHAVALLAPEPNAADAVAASIRRTLALIEQFQGRVDALATLGADARARGFRDYVSVALAHGEEAIHMAQSFAPNGAAVAALEDFRKRWASVSGVYSSLGEGAYTDALTQTTVLFSDLFKTPLPENTLRGLTFAAAVATAQTGAEVDAAFRASAMPAGGFRGKRHADDVVIALNAYPALGLHTEWLFSGGVHAEGDPAFGVATPSLSLPIGLELHTRLGIPGGVSFLVPLLDLGALLNYRLKRSSARASSDTTMVSAEVGQFPDVTLQHVFSPGLYVLWGPADHPLTFGLGAQLTPRLRSIDATGANDARERLDALRLGFIVGVDLTLFRF